MSSDGQASSGHATALDPSAMQVATVYAKAFLGAAEAAHQTDALVAEVDSLIVDVLDRLPSLESVLSSAMVSHDEKLRLIDRAFGGKAAPILINFLKVVSAHGRLNILRQIRTAVHTLFDQMRGRVRVQVRTAVPIDETLAQRIAHSVQERLGGVAILERQIDPNLIGGVVLRVG